MSIRSFVTGLGIPAPLQCIFLQSGLFLIQPMLPSLHTIELPVGNSICARIHLRRIDTISTLRICLH
jgi:hypothetical protein